MILKRKRIYHTFYREITQNLLKLIELCAESQNAELAETSSEMNEEDCLSTH